MLQGSAVESCEGSGRLVFAGIILQRLGQARFKRQFNRRMFKFSSVTNITSCSTITTPTTFVTVISLRSNILRNRYVYKEIEECIL